jgi:hypothetical protein
VVAIPLEVKISTRLVAAYVVLLLSIATTWLGLHSLPKWLLFAVFFVGFFAAGVTAIHPWIRKRPPRHCPICGGDVSAASSRSGRLVRALSHRRAYPLAWGFVFGGAVAAAQVSIASVLAIVSAWILVLLLAAYFVQYRCTKCGTVLSYNGRQ